jgi:hypothetical protein
MRITRVQNKSLVIGALTNRDAHIPVARASNVALGKEVIG